MFEIFKLFEMFKLLSLGLFVAMNMLALRVICALCAYVKIAMEMPAIMYHENYLLCSPAMDGTGG